MNRKMLYNFINEVGEYANNLGDDSYLHKILDKYYDKLIKVREEKPVLIAFSGKARHGKTTAADLAIKILNEKCLYAKKFPLAEELKEQAKLLGWDGGKDEKGRRLLQELSWPVKHYHGEDYYAKIVGKKIKEDDVDVALVDDARMTVEMDYFNNHRNDFSKVLFIRINRPDFVSDLNEEAMNDISETALDDYQGFDYYINNVGTLDDFQDKIEEILKKEGIIKSEH